MREPFSAANIFPTTLNTAVSGPKGYSSITAGKAAQASIASSPVMGAILPHMAIYHLARAADWAAAPGDYRVSTLGLTLDEVGFIHASYLEQVADTAERFYRDEPGELIVLVIDDDGLDVREEGGFPHLYGPLPVAAVTTVVPVWFDSDGRFVFEP